MTNEEKILEMLSKMDERQNKTEELLGRLTADVADMKADMADMKDRQARMETDLSEVKDRQLKMEMTLEHRVAERLDSMFEGYQLLRETKLDKEEFEHFKDDLETDKVLEGMKDKLQWQ